MASNNPSLIKGIASGNVPAHAAQAVPTNTGTLTDSTGGTANTTLAAVTAVNGSGATTAQEGVINDNFADIAAQLAIQKTLNTAIIEALQKSGIIVQS